MSDENIETDMKAEIEKKGQRKRKFKKGGDSKMMKICMYI